MPREGKRLKWLLYNRKGGHCTNSICTILAVRFDASVITENKPSIGRIFFIFCPIPVVRVSISSESNNSFIDCIILFCYSLTLDFGRQPVPITSHCLIPSHTLFSAVMQCKDKFNGITYYYDPLASVFTFFRFGNQFPFVLRKEIIFLITCCVKIEVAVALRRVRNRLMSSGVICD